MRIKTRSIFDDSGQLLENVEINEDGTFNIYVDFEEQGKGTNNTMEGLRHQMSEPHTVKMSVKCKT